MQKVMFYVAILNCCESRLPRRTERKRRFGVWKERYQAEAETSARAIHLPNCTAGCHGLYKKKCFIGKLPGWKQVSSQGEKWSEALTRRKTDRHKECSLLLLEPGARTRRLWHQSHPSNSSMCWALSSSIHSVLVVTLAALICSRLWHWWKKISCSTCRYLKNVGTDSIYHTPG